MPTYEYVCKNILCDLLDEPVQVQHEMDLSHKETCQACGEEMSRLISGGVGFVLSGNDFAGKNFKVKGQMQKRTKEARKKGFIVREQEKLGLVPNHEGEVVSGSRLEPETWEKVKEIAKKSGVQDEETQKRRTLTERELLTYDRKIEEVQKRKKKETDDFKELRTPGIIT